MSTKKDREALARRLGYEVVTSYLLPRADWQAFYDDMEQVVQKAAAQTDMNRTYSDMCNEIEVDKVCGDEYGFVCLLLKKINT
ncbi:MAG: hypothetical protein JXR76_17145 [Deltaproteobacteria bacterium]|nr:hypothetical protein [Deltaproteobacteria bacterium]